MTAFDPLLVTAGTGLLLGMAGSVGHCTGMCGGITLLLGRGERPSPAMIASAHLGRVTTYALLGLVAGLLGAIGRQAPDFGPTEHAAAGHAIADRAGTLHPLAALQAAVALTGAAVALCFALALLGRMPPPDRFLAVAARWWGGAMRRTSRRASAFEAGLVWGLLPCGLALTGLVAAAAAGTAHGGALTMLAFGAGTLPVHAALALAGHGLVAAAAAWPRRMAALVTGAFGAQLALRGLATLGAVGHFSVGQVALW